GSCARRRTPRRARRPRAGRSSCSACRTTAGTASPIPARATCGRRIRSGVRRPRRRRRSRAGLIGSPETIRRRLREFEAAGVDQVILLNQAGRTTHEDICRSLELFAREVMPEFHAREPEHERWKADVLAGRISLEGEQAETYKLY